MPTGACGVDCDVCLLRLTGACSTCGAGTRIEAERKWEAQIRLLGSPCPILDCARTRRVAFCLRDCASFPCGHFRAGPYPFSQGFLAMQERRRSVPPPAYAPDGSHLRVALDYWERLKQKDLLQLSALTQFELTHDRRILFKFLNRNVWVDPESCCLRRPAESGGEMIEDPLLELVCVLYLINVKDVYPLGRDIVGPQDLKEGHFFQGPHELRLGPLVERYGKDLPAFRRAAQKLDGEGVAMADAAVRLKPFPRLHLYYLLWQEDEEFPARASVLFERSIENVLAADAIWALVNRVSTELLSIGV
jgi:hypothetical protein